MKFLLSMHMGKLERLKRKKKKLVVGLMSGTSVDSIDAVLVEISGFGITTKLKQRTFTSHPYPKGFRKYVLHNSLPGTGTVDTISQLNILIAYFFADAVKAVARKGGVALNSVDLIGSHGQTVHHIPDERKLFGKRIRSTLQLGDPSTIATLTGVPTVGNFRTADMALGGQGAPLVSYFDFLMFRSATKDRALLNIGGIANMTLLKKNCPATDIVAFDTGPGNMVIDALMKKLYGKEFDRNGETARSGRILSPVLKKLMAHKYFSHSLPKSTGRELFGTMFVEKIMNFCRGKRKEDILATVTEFTALSIFDQFNRFLKPHLGKRDLDELIVSGGGAMNGMWMDSLRRYFHPAKILLSTDLGVDSDAKEALCFALLANETIHEVPANVPSVTGAYRHTILGEICL
ncbi:MAG: anhydro-N-acetylmuramic acid kinase [Ignavibacteriales bacterium]|nr:anhydro-N-acetylmuramic acid kinase [Ignavibacteriales bacterium]